MRNLLLLLLCCGSLSAEQVIEKNAELRLLSKAFSFTEGPVADESGDVYFTDQPNNRIVKYSFQTDEFSDWLKPAGRSNGLYFAAPGQLIACADANNELWKISVVDKSHQVIAKGLADERFNGPNDCWVNSDGSIYFTDPLYPREYWKHEPSRDRPRAVYHRSANGDVQLVAEFKQPNGIIGDAKNQTLYVADIGGRKTYRFKIQSDGKLIDRELFCDSGSDGMTIDERRNVYLTGSKGVTVYNPKGDLVQTIAVPRGWTANVTFAGPHREHLFITSGNAVFVIKMAVRGIAPARS